MEKRRNILLQMLKNVGFLTALFFSKFNSFCYIDFYFSQNSWDCRTAANFFQHLWIISTLFSVSSYTYSSNLRLLHNSEINVLCTYTFLEQQISASLALKSPQEFRHWLLTLVQFLVQQGKTIDKRINLNSSRCLPSIWYALSHFRWIEEITFNMRRITGSVSQIREGGWFDISK